MNDQEFQRDLVSYQQEQEFFKHLTTLSTGAILLMVTFLEKLFANPEWKPLIGVSLLAFTGAIVGSIVLHYYSFRYVNKPEQTISTSAFIIGGVGYFFALGGFLIGLIALVVFAVKNLY